MRDRRSPPGRTPPLPPRPAGRGGAARADTPQKGAASGAGRPNATPEGFVLVGEFGRAQGLRGEVRLKSHTADPKGIASYNPLQGADGRRYEIASLRAAPGSAPDMLVARVKGVEDRTAAEALNRLRLFAPRDRIAADAEEDEFLLADLIGLSVENPAGEALGRIAAVPNYGAGDLLEIAPPGGGPTALLPFLKVFVPVVDIPAGRVVIEAPVDLFAAPEPAPDDEPIAPGSEA